MRKIVFSTLLPQSQSHLAVLWLKKRKRSRDNSDRDNAGSIADSMDSQMINNLLDINFYNSLSLDDIDCTKRLKSIPNKTILTKANSLANKVSKILPIAITECKLQSLINLKLKNIGITKFTTKIISIGVKIVLENLDDFKRREIVQIGFIWITKIRCGWNHFRVEEQTQSKCHQYLRIKN